MHDALVPLFWHQRELLVDYWEARSRLDQAWQGRSWKEIDRAKEAFFDMVSRFHKDENFGSMAWEAWEITRGKPDQDEVRKAYMELVRILCKPDPPPVARWERQFKAILRKYGME